MKKYKLRKWVKYTMLGIINFIIIINLPNILIEINNNANNFRYNILVITVIIVGNILSIKYIEKEN